MSIFDLLFLFSFLLIAAGIVGLLVALFLRRRRLALRLAIGLVIYAGVYVLLLVSVSLLSPQRVLAMHEVRCFDDWCMAVEQVEQRPAIGSAQAQGGFYLVTLQVSSQAKRIRQRELDTAVFLVDERGVRYDPSPSGQQALEAAGQAGQPLNSWLDAGAAFTHIAVFDLPPGVTQPGLVISHGAFPGSIIIGDDQSFLHKPTIMSLSQP